MRGGRVALLSLVMLTPLAVADAILAPDPFGDERTTLPGPTIPGQPEAVVCHDASIDFASIHIERGSTVRVTFTFHGPIAAPLLTCNDQAVAASERSWFLTLNANVELFASARAGSGAPTVDCLKASNPAYGNSRDCLGTVNMATDGFWFEVPATRTFTYEGGQAGSYDLRGLVVSHPLSASRLNVGMQPVQRTLAGVSDFSDARLG